jgi:hypothetical protein
MPVPDYLAEEHAEDVAQTINEDGVPAELFALMDALTDEQRLEVFAIYCTHCGTPASRCNCWRDE